MGGGSDIIIKSLTAAHTELKIKQKTLKKVEKTA